MVTILIHLFIYIIPSFSLYFPFRETFVNKSPQIKLAPFQYSVQSRKQKEQSQQMNCESIS